MVETSRPCSACGAARHVTFEGPLGPVAVRTLPRPMQPELPFLGHGAGNPETFEMAGAWAAACSRTCSARAWTSSSEQDPRAYREAWKKAGHPGEGFVVLMLHTFVGHDDAP
jgi:alkanesulfonate monooxygenase SsuD/methylene tetrahydromethanopterin reductase-like flavin-dependent oxidoreductase (luciferase family)